MPTLVVSLGGSPQRLANSAVPECAEEGRYFRSIGAAQARVPCAETVPESDVFMPLGLALSEEQIPQITENTEKTK